MSSSKNFTRRLTRVAIVQALYQTEQNDDKSGFVIEQFLKFRLDSSAIDSVFFKEAIIGIEQTKDILDQLIKKYLSDKWQLERLSTIVRAILRAATWELNHSLTPTAVVINEYIEVAREFIDETAFIHGILDSIATREQRFISV